MKKTKIAFFAEILIEDFDGASRTMFHLIKRIPSLHFEFLFICGRGPAELSGFECLRVPTLTLPINSRYTMALPYLDETRLNQKLATFAPDVIHIATPSLLGDFALRYAQTNSLPVLSIYHTHFISYVAYYFSLVPFLINFLRGALAANLKTFYNRCQIIYVPSESIATEMQEMGIEHARMKIWQRGIDTTLFSPQKMNKKAIHLLTGNDFPTILFASRLVWEKNLQTLIRIYEHCQREDLNYNFIIVGDGVARKACQRRMKKAIFTGTVKQEQLSELYASADIFLFTSTSESYGNVVLEAMASGLPCVIADGGGSQDFIIQGYNGFKCPPDDEVAYINKIKLVLQNDTLKTQFSQTGLQYSTAFDWNKLSAIYFEDLRKLALSIAEKYI